MSRIEKWENAEPGVKRKIFSPGKSIMMMEVHFEEGAEGYLHSHPHEQFSYCIKGSIEFQVGEDKQIVSAGQTIFIPSGVSHGVKALEASILLDAFTPLREDLLK